VGREIEKKPKARRESTKVIDLVSVLQESLAKSQGGKKKKSGRLDEPRSMRNMK
jgi:non-homologous end joining protein Ku